ncbi:MAG: ABC transporter permease, partial [Xanthobacteraceae bacterium]
MSTMPALNETVVGGQLQLAAAGSWTVANSEVLEQLVQSAAGRMKQARAATIDMAGVRELDTLGAWLLERLARGGSGAQFVGLPGHFRGLFEEVRQVNRRKPAAPSAGNKIIETLDKIGHATVDLKSDLADFFAMFGVLGATLLRVLLRPQTFRLTSTIHHLYRVGWQAIPIMLLITFLIGGIIAQQGFFHFRKFGAEPYVVDMVGILVLRELGVLIVSIMIAGRSGSAYTAELGSMKMREEIDALRTMGFDPVEVLILPRVIALVIAVPILTFFGSMAALYGGGLVAQLYGDMSPSIFIARLKEAISVTHFEVGM